jgi:hypothetical protein
MSNEDGYFEIFWALRRQKTWERSRTPSDPVKFPIGWGDGHKEIAREGWMARASLTAANPEAKPE